MTDKNTSNSKASEDKSENTGARQLQNRERKENEDEPLVERYFTEDGTPVEPSTIPPKAKFEPDMDARPDVHARVIPAKNADVRNEKELDEQLKREDEKH